MVNPLTIFPGLARTKFQITSPPSDEYNCIAWAAQDNTQWWWPDEASATYWPAEAIREETLIAFEQAFAGLVFAHGDHHDLEEGTDKIAIFAKGGKPTHAARQLPNGQWTSKLGLAEDMEHELHALEGEIYGKVALIMKRTRSNH